MTVVVGGSSPQITFADSTVQNTAALPLTGGAVSADITVHGLTVGLGGGSISTNTAVGVSALSTNTTGATVTAIGYQAAKNSSTGGDITAIGNNALATYTGGGDVTAVGSQALVSATTGVELAALGYSALRLNTIGNYNTGIGSQALYNNTTASNNTAVGYQAGNNVTTGSQHVLIGAGANPSGATTTNEIVIGYSLTGIGSGYVSLGVAGVGATYNQFSSNATWSHSSDINLKQNIKNDTLGLSFINKLQTVTYQWKPNNELPKGFRDYQEENVKDTSTVMHGLIAQNVKQALDDVGVSTFGGWSELPDGSQSISREMFVIPLIKAVQELSAQVTALQAQIATLTPKS
jgi:hypothetical protein